MGIVHMDKIYINEACPIYPHRHDYTYWLSAKGVLHVYTESTGYWAPAAVNYPTKIGTYDGADIYYCKHAFGGSIKPEEFVEGTFWIDGSGTVWVMIYFEGKPATWFRATSTAEQEILQAFNPSVPIQTLCNPEEAEIKYNSFKLLIN